MKYAKPPLTFEQQADQLIARGMVGDRATMIARLSTVNYYRLSAYWYTFRIPGTEDLRPGTSFEHVWDRYVFDQKLRLLMIEAIERIEVAVRTQLAYHHAHAHGPFAYAQDPKSLPGFTDGDEREFESHAYFMKEVRKCIKRSKETFVRHYRSKYSAGDLPIWMATELMTLGSVLSLYQGCDNRERHPVAASYGMLISEFESWLMMLHHVRNVCAHHARLWNRKLAKQPSIPNDWTVHVPVDPTTIFAALTVCAYCLDKIAHDASWPRRVRDLIDAYPAIPKGRTTHSWTMGLPPNWLDCPIWAGAR